MVLLMLFMKRSGSGMVGNEDRGSMMGGVRLGGGSCEEGGMEVLGKVERVVGGEGGVECGSMICGYRFIGGEGGC